jgi:hypothetical protein
VGDAQQVGNDRLDDGVGRRRARQALEHARQARGRRSTLRHGTPFGRAAREQREQQRPKGDDLDRRKRVDRRAQPADDEGAAEDRQRERDNGFEGGKRSQAAESMSQVV